MDTLSPAERSERMARVRSKDSKPELLVCRPLHGLGYRVRLAEITAQDVRAHLEAAASAGGTRQ